jgi:hypothetical protein
MPYGLPLDFAADLPPEVMENAGVIAFEAAVNSTWELGLDNRTKVMDKVASIVADLQNTLNTPTMTGSVLTPATVDEPLVNIPSSVTPEDLYAEFEAQSAALITEFEAKRTSFIADYFPTEDATYTLGENWLSAAIGNPNVGIPPSVAAQIFGDETERILADANQASDAVIAQFASRGFPLPPDAAASAVLQIQQKAQGLTAEAARKVAIASVEMQKWIVERIMSLREMALKSILDYVKVIALGPEIASKLVPVGYDAQSKLISAVSAYYNARTGAKELTFKGTQHNADMAQAASVENLKSEMLMVTEWVKAILMEVQTMSQMATSLFNNIHAQTSLGVSNSKSVSQSI